MNLRLKDILRITKNVKFPKKQRLRRPRIVVLKRSPRSQIPFPPSMRKAVSVKR
jgi:hypothetical protein